MRTILVMAAALAMTGFAAQAAELRMTVEKPHFTCEGRSMLFHVAYVPGSAEQRPVSSDAPLPCCDGKIGCAQFLSTNTILHPEHPQRG